MQAEELQAAGRQLLGVHNGDAALLQGFEPDNWDAHVVIRHDYFRTEFLPGEGQLFCGRRSDRHRKGGKGLVERTFAQHHPCLKLGEVEGFCKNPCSQLGYSFHVVVRDILAREQSNVFALALSIEDRLNKSEPGHIGHIDV